MLSPIGRRRCGCGATSYDFAVTATAIAHPARPRQDDAADPGASRPQSPAARPCATARMRRPLRRYPTRGWRSIRRRWPRRRLSTECAGPAHGCRRLGGQGPRRTGSNHRPVVSAGAIVTGVSGAAAIAGPVERIRGGDRYTHRRPSTTGRDACSGWLPPLIRWHVPFKNAVACGITFQTPICPRRAAVSGSPHCAAVRPAPAVRYWRRCRRRGRCRPAARRERPVVAQRRPHRQFLGCEVEARNCLNAGLRRAGEVFVAENGRN
jgi:hypothetical protein